MEKAGQLTIFLLNDYGGQSNMKMYIYNVTRMEMRFLKDLKKYFEFYNKERFHQSLDYKTPSSVYYLDNVA